MILKLENISKSYGIKEQGNQREVLKDLSFEINKGECIAIIGPSGSGKTTLLNIIGTFDFPDGGKVLFNNQDISGLSEKEVNSFRNEQVGTVFQLHHLLPQCTLLENILIPTLPLKAKTEKVRKRNRAEELMKSVGIWDMRHQKPSQLSGGECQRAAVVRAMINEPSLILADEPTGALDEENVEKIADLLLDINRKYQLSLLVVTHSYELAKRMDKIYELKNGKLLLKI
jgi:ABC-type lipoprotein export system ATPase subunit